jgi:hypothetical protein
MSDKQNDQPGESEERSPAPPTGSEKPRREVFVTHLDSPPPSGKRSIHPRRPAPIVPTREQRTGEQSAHDADADADSEGSSRERPNRRF